MLFTHLHLHQKFQRTIFVLLLGGIAGFLGPRLLLKFSTNLVNLKIEHSIIKKVSATIPTIGSSYLFGVMAFQHQQYSLAVMGLTQAQKEYNRPLTRWYLAKALSAAGQWHTAIEQLNQQIPQENKLRQQILKELFDRILSFDEQKQKGWLDNLQQQYPDLLLPFAGYLSDVGQHERAIHLAMKFPDYTKSAEAQLVIGWGYFYLNHFANASQHFAIAYQLAPSGATEFAYGRSRLFGGKVLESIPLLEEAVQRESNTAAIAWYLIDLGRAYAQQKECQKADLTFKRAILSDSRFENLVIQARKDSESYC